MKKRAVFIVVVCFLIMLFISLKELELYARFAFLLSF